MSRSVRMSQQLTDMLQEERQRFIDKFGREPGPNDRVLFDMPHPEVVKHRLVQIMKEAGMPPDFIYAFEKTGLMVGEDNQHLLPEAALDEWYAAVEEFRAQKSRRRK